MSVEVLEPNELIVFDYDGTVAAEGGRVADSVLLGVEALWLAGVSTTAITARPYQRLTTVCGGVESINKLISPRHPLATERGGRIVDANRISNLEYHPLDIYELDAIADMDAHEGIDFVGFYPKELHGTSYIWSPDAARTEEMASRFGHDATILSSENSVLRHSLHTAEPCLVTVRFKTHSESNREILQEDLNVAWERKTAAIVTEGTNKLSALGSLCEATGIHLNAIRYAGNDTSDLPVLQIPELRERIFVGDNQVNGMTEPVTRIASPEALGDYLIQLAGMEIKIL